MTAGRMHDNLLQSKGRLALSLSRLKKRWISKLSHGIFKGGVEGNLQDAEKRCGSDALRAGRPRVGCRRSP